jgi:predicted phosphodiesterase
MGVKWEGQIEARRVELIKDRLTYKQVARILSDEFNTYVSDRAVEGRCFRSSTMKSDICEEICEESYNQLINKNPISTSEGKLFPDECYDVDSEICMTPAKIAELNDIYKQLTLSNPKKILALSDLHAPLIDFSAVEKAILAHPDADICLLNGDVYDGQAMSTFDKLKDFDFEVELRQIFILLDVLTKRFKHVVWVGGNHDMRRFLKFVMKTFGSGMKNYVLKRLNPMDYVAERYDNLIIVPHDWIQVGDVIFAHLQDFSITDMKTVVSCEEKFRSMKHLLPNPDYRSIVIGHTHHMGKVIRNNVLLMEQGCMCHMADYKFHKPSRIRWETGYAVIYFDDDMKVDFNKSNIVWIEK